MQRERFSRRALLGTAAATALAGCSGVTDRVPEELGGDGGGFGGGNGGSAVGDETKRAIVRPIFQLVRAYNDNRAGLVDTFLTPESPVREELSMALLEAHEITSIGIDAVTREDETTASVEVGISYRSVVEESGRFTTRFENRRGEDYWLVHDIDDPAPILSMEGIPTSTPEPTPASEPLDGFEGSLAPWEPYISRFGQREDEVYAGSYSGGITTDREEVGHRIGTVAEARPRSLAGGREPRRLSYYYLEREANAGAALRVRNSRGVPELGVAAVSPAWVVDDRTGAQTVYEGDGYDRWVRVDITFDWEARGATVAFEDLESGTTASATAVLYDGIDVEFIDLVGFTPGEGPVTDACYMFWDEVTLEFVQ